MPRVIVRLLARFCRARADAAQRRASASRFASCFVLAEVASPFSPRSGRGPAQLAISRHREVAERDEESCRQWRSLARRVEAL